jgi:hypothetical protein
MARRSDLKQFRLSMNKEEPTMRNLIVGLTLIFASPAFSADLAEGWASLGQINAQVDGEDLDMTVVSGPDGSPHAFQIDAGGPIIVRVQGYVVSDSGTPGWPNLAVDVLTMGSMVIVQEVQFYKSGGTNPEMWLMREDLGSATISGGKLTDDEKFVGTLEATLHRWNLVENAEVAGENAISIKAEISSQVPRK